MSGMATSTTKLLSIPTILLRSSWSSPSTEIVIETLVFYISSRRVVDINYL